MTVAPLPVSRVVELRLVVSGSAVADLLVRRCASLGLRAAVDPAVGLDALADSAVVLVTAPDEVTAARVRVLAATLDHPAAARRLAVA